MTLKENNSIVGIDFGTSGSRVAALIRGRPTMIEGPDGESTMPADVLVRRDGTTLVGAAARRQGPVDGAVVVHAAKRLLGRAWDDPAINDVRGELGDSLVRSSEGLPLIKVGDTSLTPAQICSLMLRQLRTDSSRALGLDVSRAVLAVPADYGFIQRRALNAVAIEAGLDVVRIVSEPTAAALYRGQGADNRKIAVYDFGGGTFDISILDIGDGVYEVLATDGDPFLGGEDIDQRLLTHVLELSGIATDELDQHSTFVLRTAVEKLKRDLSGHDSGSIVHPTLLTKSGRSVAVSQVISRETLQNICQDLIDRTLVICRRALDSIEDGKTKKALEPSDIDVIVLVGGTTRLPFIEDCVTRFFGKAPEPAPRREDSVALGCAMYGGMLSGETREPLLLDVLPRSYAIQVGDNEPVILLSRNSFAVARGQFSLRLLKVDGNEVLVRVLEIGTATITAVTEFVFTPVLDGLGGTELDLALDMSAGGELELRIVDRIGGGHLDRRLEADLATAGMIATTARADLEAFTAPDREPSGSIGPNLRHRRILAVATEWSSGAGGLSTFNREFCLALSAAGHDVRCLVLSATAQEQQAAETAGVKLVEAIRTPGMTQQAALGRKPAMDDNWRPEIVIGHGRVTGPAAVSIASDDYPESKRLHLIHMAPDEIEWFKLDRSDDAGERADERTKTERDLGTTASYVVAVGPRLHNRYLTEFEGTGKLPIRLDPGFDSSGVTPIGPPAGAPWRVLLVGRAEDEELKGLDIAGAALGVLSRRWSGARFELRVRGAPEGGSETLRRKLIEWSGVPGLRVVVQPFSSSADDLSGDYKRSSIVLMPSRSEGFGLVGLEAICAGVPVLASNESGLAELLQQELSPEEANRIIVPVTHDLETDADAWARAIERLLLDRNAAFKNAERLRESLGGSATWARAVEDLFEAMERSDQAA